MRRIRDLLCTLALTALIAVSLWAAVTVAREFPGPSGPEPIDVRHWLTQRDLSAATSAERSRVMRQFERQLRGGENLAAGLPALDSREQELLAENVSLLLEQWFRMKVDSYHAQRPDRRARWLDGQLEQIQQMAGRGRDAANAPLGLPGSLYALGKINSQVEQWIERADPKDQDRMRDFWRAVQERTMSRQRPKKARDR
jgi:hypothetical protein